MKKHRGALATMSFREFLEAGIESCNSASKARSHFAHSGYLKLVEGEVMEEDYLSDSDVEWSDYV